MCRPLKLNLFLTLHVQTELSSEAGISRNDDLTEVASRVRLLGVVDVQGHVTWGHAADETNTTLKLGAAHTHGVFCVGDNLEKTTER